MGTYSSTSSSSSLLALYRLGRVELRRILVHLCGTENRAELLRGVGLLVELVHLSRRGLRLQWAHVIHRRVSKVGVAHGRVDTSGRNAPRLCCQIGLVLQLLLGQRSHGVLTETTTVRCTKAIQWVGRAKAIKGIGIKGWLLVSGSGTVQVLREHRRELSIELSVHARLREVRVSLPRPWAVLLLLRAGVIPMVVPRASAGGKTNLIHQALVALAWGGLQLRQDLRNVLDNLSTHGLVKEWRSQDLEDQSGARGLVAQDLFENLISRTEEQSLQDNLACFRLIALVDDLQNSQIGDLVSAKVDKVRHKSGCEHSATARESAGVQEPSKQQRAVGIGRKLHAVKGNGSREHALLILGRVVTFKTSTHGTSTEPSLSNLPHAAQHGLEDEVIVGSTEAQAALENVVAVLVQKEGNSGRTESIDNHLHLRWGLGDIDDLLRSPGTVLVYTNFSKMGRNRAQHSLLCGLRAVLEEFLDDRVTQVVRRQLCDFREHRISSVFDLLNRARSIVDTLANVPKTGCVEHPGLARFGDSSDLILECLEGNCFLNTSGNVDRVLVSGTKFLDNLRHLRLQLGKGRDLRNKNLTSVSIANNVRLKVRVGSGRGLNTISTRCARSRGTGNLSVANPDRTCAWEDLLSVEQRLGLDGTLDTLKVDKATVLVGQHTSRLNLAIYAEDSLQRGDSGGDGDATDPQGASRAILVVLVCRLSRWPDSQVRGIASSELHHLHRFGQLIIFAMLRDVQISGAEAIVKSRRRGKVVADRGSLGRRLQYTSGPGTRPVDSLASSMVGKGLNSKVVLMNLGLSGSQLSGRGCGRGGRGARGSLRITVLIFEILVVCVFLLGIYRV